MVVDGSLDKFLGGEILAEQPKTGFRAGTDTVLLAATIDAKRGDAILELGTGSGVALCCVGARQPECELIGVELDPQNAARANRNLVRNGLRGHIYETDVFELPNTVRMRQFHHVFLNPPFYNAGDHRPPTDDKRALAHIDQHGVAKWIAVGRSRLAPRGVLSIIHRASALQEILTALDGMGNIHVLPIASKAQNSAKSVIVQATLDRRAPLTILAPLILYDDSGTPSAQAQAITRGGAAYFLNKVKL